MTDKYSLISQAINEFWEKGKVKGSMATDEKVRRLLAIGNFFIHQGYGQDEITAIINNVRPFRLDESVIEVAKMIKALNIERLPRNVSWSHLRRLSEKSERKYVIQWIQEIGSKWLTMRGLEKTDLLNGYGWSQQWKADPTAIIGGPILNEQIIGEIAIMKLSVENIENEEDTADQESLDTSEQTPAESENKQNPEITEAIKNVLAVTTEMVEQGFQKILETNENHLNLFESIAKNVVKKVEQLEERIDQIAKPKEPLPEVAIPDVIPLPAEKLPLMKKFVEVRKMKVSLKEDEQRLKDELVDGLLPTKYISPTADILFVQEDSVDTYPKDKVIKVLTDAGQPLLLEAIRDTTTKEAYFKIELKHEGKERSSKVEKKLILDTPWFLGL